MRKANKAANKPAKANKPAPEAASETPAPVATVAAKATPEPDAKPVLHAGFAGSYSGPSGAIRKRASKNHAIADSDIAPKAPGSFTYRDDCAMRDLLALYGDKPFSAAALDRGIRQRGAGLSIYTLDVAAQTVTLTPVAIAYCGKNKPLTAGASLPADLFTAALKRA